MYDFNFNCEVIDGDKKYFKYSIYDMERLGISNKTEFICININKSVVRVYIRRLSNNNDFTYFDLLEMVNVSEICEYLKSHRRMGLDSTILQAVQIAQK